MSGNENMPKCSPHCALDALIFAIALSTSAENKNEMRAEERLGKLGGTSKTKEGSSV